MAGTSRGIAVLVLLLFGAVSSFASDASPTPGANPTPAPPSSPSRSALAASAVPSATPLPASPRVAVSISPTAKRSPGVAAESESESVSGSVANPATAPLAVPTAPPVAVRPRAFRTPIRDAPPAFVAPEPEEAPDAAVPDRLGRPPDHMPAAQGASVTVVFRAVARTAINGFDLRVTYPLAAGDFAGSADHVQCSIASGVMLIPNDHDDGTLRLIVASAQTLPTPLAISCRFDLAAGARLDARAIGVQVAEVTVGDAKGDPSLLTVGIDVR